MSLPDPSPVLGLLDAFRGSKVMFTAVSLGVFDRLSEGPAPFAVLAEGRNSDAMRRLLDACVGLGLLTKEADRYRNTAAAATYLRRDSPHTLTGYILYSHNVLWRLWANLDDAVREGTHRWEQSFGSRESVFDSLFRSPEAMRDFLTGMHGFGMLSSPAVAAAFDLSGFRRLVDLGGATGHLAAAAAEIYPNLEAAVFDLPKVIEFSTEFLPAKRIEWIAGDFFRDPLPEADLYAVGRILHDWSEDKIRSLVEKIYQRLPAGGGLLIAEKLLDEDKTGPLPALLQALNMLVCTEGRERTLREYEALLREAGFAEVRGRRTGAPLDAVLAVKAI